MSVVMHERTAPASRPPAFRVAAWLLMLLGMWLALKLGLVVTLLSGLLVFQLTHVLASVVEGRLRPGRARAIAVLVLALGLSGMVRRVMEAIPMPIVSTRCRCCSGTANEDRMIMKTNRLSTLREYSVM